MAKFGEYNFSEDSEFSEYLKNVYPPPSTAAEMTRIKVKWYKRKVDPNFSYEEYEKEKTKE